MPAKKPIPPPAKTPRRVPLKIVEAKRTPDPLALAADIDELGSLEAWLAPFRPKIARIEFLRAAIRHHYDSSPPLSTFTVTGARFVLMIGPRANESQTDIAKLLKAIGASALAEIATVTQKALAEKVSPNAIAACVTMVAKGPRPLKSFEKGGQS